MIDLEEQKRIAVEIFETTGYKVDPEDPVVIAGLFYSERLRTISQKHEKALVAILNASQEEMDKRAIELKSGIQAEVMLAVGAMAENFAKERKAIKGDFDQMVIIAKQGALGEVPGIKRDLSTFFEKMKASLPLSEIQALTISVPVFCTSLALSMLAGSLASYIFLHSSPNDLTTGNVATTGQSVVRPLASQAPVVKKESRK